MTQIQEILLEVWKDFQDFCSLHELKYYACGGTAIGTIRHKGFIPWDDDIDVYMPLDDYVRFLELKEKLVGSKYEIIDMRNENYYLPGFSKFSRVASSIWEERCYPFIMGVYIDVFPLYEIDNRKNFLSIKRLIEYYNDVYARSILRYDIKHIGSILKQRNFRTIISTMLNIFYHRKRKNFYRKKLCYLYKKAAEQKGEYLVNYTLNPNSDMFEKKWFETILCMPFENQTMNMPIGYHHYLETRFGDYMALPPVEARKTHHKRYFEDFEKRYTIEEVKDIIRCNHRHP